MNLKKTILILGLACFLLLVFVLILLLRKNYLKREGKVIERGQKIEEKKGEGKVGDVLKKEGISLPKQLQASQRILSFILSYRDPQTIPGTQNRTLYPLYIKCSRASCRPSGGDRQVSLPVILSNLELYKKGNVDEALELAQKDFAYLENQAFQPDYLHCSLLEKIEEEGLFEGDFEGLCRRAIFLKYSSVLSFSKSLDLFGIENDKVKGLLEGRVLESFSYPVPLPRDDREFSFYAAYAYDFARRYFFLNSPQSLSVARAYFDLAIYYWAQNRQREKELVGKPFLAAASFSLFKATGEKRYDDLGFYLANRALRSREKRQELLNSLFLNEVLYERTGDERYLKDLRAVLDYLEKNFVDKNGLWRAEVSEERYYYTRDNALLSYFLLRWRGE